MTLCVCVCVHGVRANVLDCDIIMGKLNASHYYIDFEINILGKGMNSLTPSTLDEKKYICVCIYIFFFFLTFKKKKNKWKSSKCANSIILAKDTTW